VGWARPTFFDYYMVEHVQPMPDGVLVAPARPRSRGRAFVADHLSWVLNEALLFPVVALYLITLAGALPRELLSDSWFVILGGREVAQHGLPSHDVITVWAHGRHWVDQQWLGQLVFYGLYAAGGTKLALLGHVAAVGSAFTGAIVVARWRGASTRSVCWISVPAIFLLIWGSWNARAQSLAFVLFVALVWFLIHDARSPSRRVFFVLPLLALWANIHGTAITAAALVALAGAAYGFERRRQPLRGWVPRTTLLVFAPFACTLASPYALSLPAYYHRMLFNSWFRDYIVEWKPTVLSIQTGPFYLLALLAIWLLGRYGNRLLLTEKVLLGVTLLMGLQTLRSIVWFAVVALILMPTLVDGFLKTNTGAMRFPLLNRIFVAGSVAGIVVTLAVVAAKPTSWFERQYPQGALAAVTRVEAKDPHVRVFANEQYSDWLLLRHPELRGRIAYDVRLELLSQKQLQRIVDIRRRVDGWQKPIAPFGLFVLKKGVETPLGKALLRQPGARAEYRGHGILVVYRPAAGSAK
jgi:hypothetical protein